MHHKLMVIALLLALAAGCGSSTTNVNISQPTDDKAASSQAETKKAEAPRPPPAPPEEAFTAAEQKPVPPPKATGPVSPTPPPGMTMEKAQVGSGDKGRGYGGGLIGTPIATYFGVKERLVFSVQIPKAMQLFKATENRPPKSNEEFMKRIIKENDIVLPTLPYGNRYIYDPKEEQLMVIRPE